MASRHPGIPFFVWNKSTSTAKPYHLKMGMTSYKAFDEIKVLPPGFKEYIAQIIEETPEVALEYMDEDIDKENTMVLFYKASGKTDLRAILESNIPRSSKCHGGGKTKRKSKTKGKGKRKKTIKRMKRRS